MKKTILLLSLSIIFLSSCSKNFFGSGIIISEDRDVKSFHSIESSSSIKVFVSYGTTQSLTIEADDNLIDRITTTVHNNTLEIDIKKGNFSSTTLIAHVVIPELRGIISSGSGNFELSGFERLNELIINNDGSSDIRMIDYIEINRLTIDNGGSGDMVIKGDFDVFNIKNDGSGSIEARGTVIDFDIRNSGSGRIKTFKLESNICHLVNNGSGNAYVKCTEDLVINNNGSGNVYYKGTPSLTINNSGSGRVKDDN